MGKECACYLNMKWIFSLLFLLLMKDQTFEFRTEMCCMKRNAQNQRLLVNNHWERNITLKIQRDKSSYEHSNTMKHSPKTWVNSDLPIWILSILIVSRTLVPIKQTIWTPLWKPTLSLFVRFFSSTNVRMRGFRCLSWLKVYILICQAVFNLVS